MTKDNTDHRHAAHGGAHAGRHRHSHLYAHAPSHSHHQHHAHHHHSHGYTFRNVWGPARRLAVRVLRRRAVRRTIWGAAIGVGVVMAAVLALWWRLAAGPIPFDVATPWLKAAIEENFGGNHTVDVGGTQLERDEGGGTSLRIRDITVRDADGAVVASAPKAEVGLSGSSLLLGQVRAQRLDLVGAEVAVRIETDGKITVFAGADKRPIASTRVPPPAARPQPSSGGPAADGVLGRFDDLTGILAWIDNLGATGLDGHDLRELGLKNGSVVVEDRRNGKRWAFDKISIALARPAQGGIIFRVASESAERPWSISAGLRPLADGVRAVGIEARRVSTQDLQLALRLDNGEIETDVPLSASIRAEIASNGALQGVQGQLVAEAGYIRDRSDEDITINLDRANFRFRWDAQKRVLLVPFQVQSGGNQFTLLANLAAPRDDSGIWKIELTRGDPVIDPVILAGADDADEAFALNRASLRARIDTVREVIEVEQSEFSRSDIRASHNIGLAVTGSLDYSGNEPRLALGVAGTRMPISIMKRMWPIFAASKVRKWVNEHVAEGTVERIVIAGNAPLPTFKEDGPPMPEDGLSVEIETSATTIQPIASLPAIRDADLNVRISGRSARISLGRGTLEVESGRKLNIANGVFEVPDTHPKSPPSQSRFRIDGSMAAAAGLLAREPLRDESGFNLDPATTRGTLSAEVSLALPLAEDLPPNSAKYSAAIEVINFSADKMILGQKVEAASLRVNADSNGYRLRGAVKINGLPAKLELQKVKGEADAAVKLQAKIDERAGRRLGLDFNDAVTGTIPVNIAGRIRAGDNERGGLMVEADLTPVKIDNLLPGWVKLAGKSARATFTLESDIEKKTTTFKDLVIEGASTQVKGTVELNDKGDLITADFPAFSLSDGDRITLRADRGTDGVLRVLMRGDVYDGRNFIKGALAGTSPVGKPKRQTDLDLDVKIGAVAGHNGETLRGLNLKMARRGGRIRALTLSANIGQNTPLIGDLRLRARDNNQVVYIETDDAGALFRLTDMYPRMFGGKMWVAMDPPTQENTPQIGILNIREFEIRGEPGLDRVTSGAPGVPRGRVAFTQMRCDFTKFAARVVIRDGVVRGPVVGATIDGQIDYGRDQIRLGGTFVPLYGINNVFGQLPVVGILLGGGSNEGLLGITYEASGPPNAPRITINPMSAVAPGLLRKFFPAPGSIERNLIQPPN